MDMDTEFQHMKKAINDVVHHHEILFENIQRKQEILISQLRSENERLQEDLEKKARLVQELTNEIDSLKDENKSFMSVSTIVSLTNENASLRKTLAVMERTLSRRDEKRASVLETPSKEVVVVEKQPVFMEVVKQQAKVYDEPATPPPIEIVKPVMEEDTTTAASTENEAESNDDINLYEKTIKGVMYYIDDDENIYKIDENGDAGDIIGKYVIKDGKKKVQWSN